MPGCCPNRRSAAAVYCIRRLRQHLVHAFSSRPSSSADFPERVDSICRAICSEYGIAGTQTQGLFSLSLPLFTGFSNGVQNFTCVRVFVYMYNVYRRKQHGNKKETREKEKNGDLKLHKQPDVQRIYIHIIYIQRVLVTVFFFLLEDIQTKTFWNQCKYIPMYIYLQI